MSAMACHTTAAAALLHEAVPRRAARGIIEHAVQAVPRLLVQGVQIRYHAEDTIAINARQPARLRHVLGQALPPRAVGRRPALQCEQVAEVARHAVPRACTDAIRAGPSHEHTLKHQHVIAFPLAAVQQHQALGRGCVEDKDVVSSSTSRCRTKRPAPATATSGKRVYRSASCSFHVSRVLPAASRR